MSSAQASASNLVCLFSCPRHQCPTHALIFAATSLPIIAVLWLINRSKIIRCRRFIMRLNRVDEPLSRARRDNMSERSQVVLLQGLIDKLMAWRNLELGAGR